MTLKSLDMYNSTQTRQNQCFLQNILSVVYLAEIWYEASTELQTYTIINKNSVEGYADTAEALFLTKGKLSFWKMELKTMDRCKHSHVKARLPDRT